MRSTLLPGLLCCACSSPAPVPSSPAPAVLLILAHPDDETMIGVTLARLKERGVPVAALYVTRGEGGKWVAIRGGRPVEQSADPAALAIQRRAELQQASRHYGIGRLVLLDHPDEPFSDPRTGQVSRDARRFLASGVWRIPELRASIRTLAEQVQPEVVLTLRPDCAAVHAHHQAVGQLTLELFQQRQLGKRARQVYGISEVEWYPAASVPPRAGALRVPADARLAAFAQQGARLHRSQLVAYQDPPRHPELLVPLTAPLHPDPLAALLGLDASGAKR